MSTSKKVFVIGLTDLYQELIAPTAERRGWEPLPILNEDAFDGHSGYPIAEMMEAADATFASMGPVDGIVAYRDFPECTLVPELAERFKLTGPSLDAALKCEHKYWSRLEQRQAVGEHIPSFQVVDVLAEAPLSSSRIPRPYWLKPIKSFASHLAFYVDSDDAEKRALSALREGIKRVADPFLPFIARSNAPEQVRVLGAGACLAESVIGGLQCTLEGYVQNKKVRFMGLVDSQRRPGGSTLERYQYPSRIDWQVRGQMEDLAVRLIDRIGLDHTAFNIEFFYDEEKEHLWLLEINNRIAPHHALLFEAVDGRSNFEVAIDIALGEPVHPPSKEHVGLLPRGEMAAMCFLRHYGNARVTAAPAAEQVRDIERELGCKVELRVQTGDVLAEMDEQESYSYIAALIYVSGSSEAALTKRYEEVKQRLGVVFEEIPA